MSTTYCKYMFLFLVFNLYFISNCWRYTQKLMISSTNMLTLAIFMSFCFLQGYKTQEIFKLIYYKNFTNLINGFMMVKNYVHIMLCSGDHVGVESGSDFGSHFDLLEKYQKTYQSFYDSKKILYIFFHTLEIMQVQSLVLILVLRILLSRNI